jgi:hypothetical protein
MRRKNNRCQPLQSIFRFASWADGACIWVRSACLSGPERCSCFLLDELSLLLFRKLALASRAGSFQSKIVAVASAAIEEKSVEVVRLLRRTIPTLGPMDPRRANQFINGSEKKMQANGLEGDFVRATRIVATLA